MTILKSKRAESIESQLWAVDTMPFWIIFAILLAFTATFNIIYLSSQGTYKLNTGSVEEYVLIKRFIFSPNCFLLSRSPMEPNVIDFQKFSQDSLNACFKPSGTDFAFSLTLRPKDDVFAPETIKTSNWLEHGKSTKRQTNGNIRVNYNNENHEAQLNIDIQNKNA